MQAEKVKGSTLDCIASSRARESGGTMDMLVDSDDALIGLFYQDREMKKAHENFPEIVFVNAIHKKNDKRMPLYVVLVEDSNGESEIVALLLCAVMLGWLVDSCSLEAALNGTRISERMLEVVPENVTSAILDGACSLAEIKPYFEDDAWLSVMAMVEIKKTRVELSKESCHPGSRMQDVHAPYHIGPGSHLTAHENTWCHSFMANYTPDLLARKKTSELFDKTIDEVFGAGAVTITPPIFGTPGEKGSLEFLRRRHFRLGEEIRTFGEPIRVLAIA
ncbi:hypothetical protein HPB52_011186 [Rhipicephalus sanguineus]|uniref:ZSWIM1/3 RNaseH-like domain-containing protein n=1 Tax=Rhipicephalus sanguineus TaxID=34632 RepID=A0A9D4QAZ1_RHISA|nr:hypothetical protein HPB52_011186 [Rhipicephalus sanguineus]